MLHLTISIDSAIETLLNQSIPFDPISFKRKYLSDRSDALEHFSHWERCSQAGNKLGIAENWGGRYCFQCGSNDLYGKSLQFRQFSWSLLDPLHPIYNHTPLYGDVASHVEQYVSSSFKRVLNADGSVENPYLIWWVAKSINVDEWDSCIRNSIQLSYLTKINKYFAERPKYHTSSKWKSSVSEQTSLETSLDKSPWDKDLRKFGIIDDGGITQLGFKAYLRVQHLLQRPLKVSFDGTMKLS